MPSLRLRCLLSLGRGGRGATNLEPTSRTPWIPGRGRSSLLNAASRQASQSSAGVWGGKSPLEQASWPLLTPAALGEGAG